MEKKFQSNINHFNETIVRYPFNGRSKYLIDKFYIMGFDSKTLYRNLIENNANDSGDKRSRSRSNSISVEKSDSKKNPQIFHIDDPPTILNEITSDYKKQVPDKDLIKDMIFPNKLDFYWTEELPNLKTFNSTENLAKKNKQLKFKRSETLNSKSNDNNNENNDNFNYIYIEDENSKYNSKFIKPYNVIFSYNPQTENSSKKSINGFAHVFYRKYYQNKKIGVKSIYFFVPIIFCIISEFPFYNSFYLLCNQFKNLYIEKTIEVPLEIIIYNIINFTLSPLNNDIELFIEPISFPSNQLELLIFDEMKKDNTNDIKEVEEENSILYVDKDKDEDIYEEQENSIDDKDKIKFKITKPLKRDKFNRKRKNTNYNTFNKDNLLNLNNYYSSNNELFYEIKEHDENISEDTSPDKIGDKSPVNKSLRQSLSDKNILKKIKVDKIKNTNKSNVQTHIRTYSKIDNYNSLELNISNSSNSTANVNDFKLFENIKFGFLSGYPLIQYNLVKVLLNVLSPQDVIIIFFHTFLEKDVVFFSKDIEYLSLTIDAYLNLNFPLNDEKYYFFNACVSYENYINNNSTFVGSTFTTILGVNNQYPQDYKNTNMAKSKEHLCVDLDNGNLYFMKGNSSNSLDSYGNIDFIRKICKNKDFKEDREKPTILCSEIKKIYAKLCDYKTKLNNKNNTEFYNNISNAKLIDYNEDKRKYKKSINIKAINKDIQECFYRLINNLCLYFYQNLTIKDEIVDRTKQTNKKVQFTSSIRKSLVNSVALDNMSIIFNRDYLFDDENTIYSKEELAFLQELTETMKFESFVYGFIQSYNPIDLYKVPLTFTEEFISILSRKNNNLKNINFNFLSLIDKLYEKNIQKKLYVDFNPFLSCYFKSYKNYFDREIYDIYNKNMNNSLINIKFTKKNDKNIIDNYKYKSYELDKNILLKYKTFINNLSKKEYRNIFYLSNILEKNNIQTIQLSDIENEIENYCIEIGLLSTNDVCCNNIILLFIMSIKDIIYQENMDCAGFLYSISQNFIVFRKYYTMIMNILYQLMKKCLNENNYTLAKKYYFCYYPCINSLRNIKLVPNESLMNIIKKFNSIKINAILEKEDIQKAKEIKDMGNNHSNINNKEYPFNYKSQYIHLIYNFDKDKFYKEKEIIAKINEPKKDELSPLYTNLKKKKFDPKIIYNDGKYLYKCKFISQAKILEILTKEYNTFYRSGFDEKILNNKEIFNACLNIDIFIRSLDNIENKDYFIYSLQCIFDHCLNKLIKNKTNK